MTASTNFFARAHEKKVTPVGSGPHGSPESVLLKVKRELDSWDGINGRIERSEPEGKLRFSLYAEVVPEDINVRLLSIDRAKEVFYPCTIVFSQVRRIKGIEELEKREGFRVWDFGFRLDVPDEAGLEEALRYILSSEEIDSALEHLVEVGE